MRCLRDRGLSALLSAALVASLVPAPALAEALDEAGLQADVPAAEEEVVVEEVEEPPAEEAADPAVAEEDAVVGAEAPATELELDKDAEVKLAEGEAWVAAFEAPEDGVYSFASERGAKARAELFSDEALERALTEEEGLVAEAPDGEDEPAVEALEAGEPEDEDDDFVLVARLAKGQKVFIEVTQRDGGELACVVKVARVEDEAAADEVVADEAEPATDEGAAEAAIDDSTEETEPAAGETVADAAEKDESAAEQSESVVEPTAAAPAEEAAPAADAVDLADVSFMVRASTYEATGEPVAPEVTARAKDGAELAEGADYEVAGYATKGGAALEGAPSEPGDYVVTYRGIGAYAGEASVSFSIRAAESEAAQEDELLAAAVSRNIADIQCSIYTYDFNDSSTGLPSFLYTGSAIKPKPHITWKNVTLEEGCDYTLSYANNVNTGTATVTIKGKGVFSGSKTVRFGIVKGYDISSVYASIDGAAFNQGVYEFFYTGSAIKPKVHMSLNGRDFIEGTDYTLSYANNTNIGTATITVKGKGCLTGTKTLQFSILGPTTLSTYLSRVYADVMCGAYTVSYSGTYSNPPAFTYTGKAITPKVQFNDGGIVEGTDFSVSYTDASGKPVTSPTAAGSYKIVLKAKAGSKKVTGTGEIPFEIVAKRALDTVELMNGGVTHVGSVDGTRVAYIDDANAGPDDLAWKVLGVGRRSYDGPALVEGVDYTKSYKKRVAGGVTYYDFTFKGTGGYEGSLSYTASFSSSPQAKFDDIFVRVNGSSIVYVGDDEVLQKPTITMRGLAENVDFAFDSFVDANGKTITKPGSNIIVYVKIKGLGTYKGSSTTWACRPVYLQPSDLAGGNITPIINNAWRPVEVIQTDVYLLKSKRIAPNVALKVYGKDVLLHEGQGFTTSTKVASDQKTANITITGTDPSLVSGTRTVTVNLVDKYDVSKASSCYLKAGSYTAGYSIGYDSTPVLPYAGFSYVPEVTFLSGNLTPVVTTTLYNASGTKVSAITKAGSYKLRVAGSGSEWGGSFDVPLEVRAQNALLLSDCEITVGEAALKNGKAEPAVTVTFGGKTFKRGEDYDVTYGNNTKAGATGWAKVTAKSGSVLAGSASKSFVVGERAGGSLTWGFDLMLRDPVTNEYYSALRATTYKAEMPRRAYAPTSRPAVRLVRQGDGSVVDPSNYTVAYRDNAKPGVASVTVTGKGAYKGTLSGNFLVVKAATTSFPDVKPGAWYALVVERAASLGLVGGYADGRFGPDDPITRGQVAVILWRMAGMPAAGSAAKSFSDVKSGAYYYAAVRWASGAGVVSGYTSSTFGPNDKVTREQLAVMLSNYARRVGGLSASGSAADYAGMTDASSVSSWARPAVGWCFGRKILSGSNGRINPRGNATRAEAAKMLVGLYDLV